MSPLYSTHAVRACPPEATTWTRGRRAAERHVANCVISTLASPLWCQAGWALACKAVQVREVPCIGGSRAIVLPPSGSWFGGDASSGIRIGSMASSHGGKGKPDDRWNRRPHHRGQTRSTGNTGPCLAVLFAFVEPEDTLDFAVGHGGCSPPEEFLRRHRDPIPNHSRRVLSCAGPSDATVAEGLDERRPVPIITPRDGKERLVHGVVAEPLVAAVEVADRVGVKARLRRHAMGHQRTARAGGPVDP